MRRMFRDIDAPYREHVREQRFAAMLEYIPEEWRRMLEMVRDRVPREDVMQACGISRATYYRRVETMRRMACEKNSRFFSAFIYAGLVKVEGALGANRVRRRGRNLDLYSGGHAMAGGKGKPSRPSAPSPSGRKQEKHERKRK